MIIWNTGPSLSVSEKWWEKRKRDFESESNPLRVCVCVPQCIKEGSLLSLTPKFWKHWRDQELPRLWIQLWSSALPACLPSVHKVSYWKSLSLSCSSSHLICSHSLLLDAHVDNLYKMCILCLNILICNTVAYGLVQWNDSWCRNFRMMPDGGHAAIWADSHSMSVK